MEWKLERFDKELGVRTVTLTMGVIGLALPPLEEKDELSGFCTVSSANVPNKNGERSRQVKRNRIALIGEVMELCYSVGRRVPR